MFSALMMSLALTAPAAAPAPDADAAAAAEPAWKTEADARIDKHRKGGFTLTLLDAEGKPVPDAEVRVEQTGHHFLFGTAVAGDPRKDNGYENPYRGWIERLFNVIVHENYAKWYHIERERDERTYELADAWLDWAEARGIRARGHCLVWSKPKFNRPWVKEIEDHDELRKEVLDHVSKTAAHFKGRFIAWDVNNEMLDGSLVRDRLGAGARAWLFKTAAAADPDTPLFINEYGIYGKKADQLIALARKLQAEGAPVGGIGLQEHQAERIVRTGNSNNDQLTPESFIGVLDKLDRELGLPIHITEVSIKTENDAEQAAALDAILRLSFSHPRVEAFLFWGFFDGRHWMKRPATFIDADGTTRPAGKRLIHLLEEEWRTDTTATTDAAGKLTFRGFYGDYRVTAGDRTWTVTLTPDATTAEAKPQTAANE